MCQPCFNGCMCILYVRSDIYCTASIHSGDIRPAVQPAEHAPFPTALPNHPECRGLQHQGTCAQVYNPHPRLHTHKHTNHVLHLKSKLQLSFFTLCLRLAVPCSLSVGLMSDVCCLFGTPASK